MVPKPSPATIPLVSCVLTVKTGHKMKSDAAYALLLLMPGAHLYKLLTDNPCILNDNDPSTVYCDSNPVMVDSTGTDLTHRNTHQNDTPPRASGCSPGNRPHHLTWNILHGSEDKGLLHLVLLSHLVPRSCKVWFEHTLHMICHKKVHVLQLRGEGGVERCV